MPIATDQDIFGLEVAIDDTCCVQSFDAFDNLGSIETRAITAQSSPSRQLSSEITTRMEILHRLLI